jgi:ABC-2 type transport system ATP-binding protein
VAEAGIETFGLSKRYGDFLALDDLTLRVERGELFGFLGPNGAGKTTTIRLLLDLLRPTRGSARILGIDCHARSLLARRQVGYLAGDVKLYDNLRGRDMLRLIADLRGHTADEEHVAGLVRELDLDISKQVKTYSKGNRQKLGIVLALMSRPPVLMLDEPTSGLDPLVQHAVVNILRREAGRGATVFFSSHVMSEVQELCDRVAILRNGKLIAVSTVEDLRARSLRRARVVFGGEAPGPGALSVDGVRETTRDGRRVDFDLGGGFDTFIKAIARYTVEDIEITQPDLEDVILGFYGDAAP